MKIPQLGFHGHINPEEVIETVQEMAVEKANGKPIVLGRSILEPIDEEARARAKLGKEVTITIQDYLNNGGAANVRSARDFLDDEGGAEFESHRPKILWKKFPILYHVDPSCAPVTDKNLVINAIDKAMNTYNTAFQVMRKDNNAVMFKRTFDEVLAQVKVRWQYIDGLGKNIGRCYYNWIACSEKECEIQSASVNFDVQDKWFIAPIERVGYHGIEFDIENHACHQIGHVIGLCHSTNSHSTMYHSCKAGQTLGRTLGASDLKSMRELYAK